MCDLTGNVSDLKASLISSAFIQQPVVTSAVCHCSYSFLTLPLRDTLGAQGWLETVIQRVASAYSLYISIKACDPECSIFSQ